MNNNLSEYILNLRKNRKLTQKKLADFLDISEDTVRGMENRRIKRASNNLVSAISGYLNVSEPEISRDIIFYDDKALFENRSFDLYSRYAGKRMLDDLMPFQSNHSSNDLPFSCILYEKTHPYKYTALISVGDLLKKHPCRSVYDLMFCAIRTVQYYDSHYAETDNRSLDFNTEKENSKYRFGGIRIIEFLFNSANKKESSLFNEFISSAESESSIFLPDIRLLLVDCDSLEVIALHSFNRHTDKT